MPANARTSTMPSVCLDSARRLAAAALALSALFAAGQQPALTADQIMARVAQNQDRSEAARAHFVYVQHARVLSRKGSTIRCEEITDTRVTPTPTGSHQQLLTVEGRLRQKNSYLTYDHLKPVIAGDHVLTESDTKSLKHVDTDDSTDVDLVENIRASLLGGKSDHDRDGINANLFPLTSKHQADYTFTLLGRESRNGRDTFHIQFRPRDKSDIGWKGDAWIDTATFQPVVIRTALSRSLPVAVRIMLGTNVPGIGFTVIYAPQSGAQPANLSTDKPAAESQPVWFPVSLGSEFKIHVLFFFSRQMVVAAENRDFERTHVTSTILPSETTALAPPQR